MCVGKTSALMTTVPAGGQLADCVGPLGVPSHVENWGIACVIGGGIGVAPIYPIAQAYKAAGNKLITIIGARSKNLLFYEEEHKAIADEMYICTDDGSYGQKGFVSDALKKLLDDGVKIGMIMAIGPVPMMRVVANLTKGYNVPTWVSLNPIMIDGTRYVRRLAEYHSMVKPNSACEDGPDFVRPSVDFRPSDRDTVGAYRELEINEAMKSYLEDQTAGSSGLLKKVLAGN
jgi:ferredoxin--NADP+ reductase